MNLILKLAHKTYMVYELIFFFILEKKEDYTNWKLL